MLICVCNSSEEFFKYYVKQINKLLSKKQLLLNSNLNLQGIISSKSKKATSIIDLLRDIPLIKSFISIQGDTFIFLSIHPLNIFQYLILKIRRKKIVQVVHDPIAHPDSKSGLVNTVTHFLCTHADRIILHSEFYRDVYSDKYGDVKVIPLLGYEPHFIPKKLSRNLLVFGRMEPYKGLANILEYNSRGVFNGWTLTIAGKGQIPEELKEMKNIKVYNRFISDDELFDLIKNTSFVFMPYDSATQSAVVLHSYSLSTPVICHDVGALREYVENTRGCIFEKNNHQELLGFLSSMTENDYQDMVCNVEEYFKSNFNDVVLSRILKKAITL